jgi:hypothetical protein
MQDGFEKSGYAFRSDDNGNVTIEPSDKGLYFLVVRVERAIQEDARRFRLVPTVALRTLNEGLSGYSRWDGRTEFWMFMWDEMRRELISAYLQRNFDRLSEDVIRMLTRQLQAAACPLQCFPE